MKYNAVDQKFPRSIIIKNIAPLLNELDILSKKLVPGFPVFRKAFLTVNGSPFGGFDGHFTFLTTI